MQRNRLLFSASLVLAVSLLRAGAARAEVLAHEGFAYPAGSNVAGHGSTADAGWAGPWGGSPATATVAPGGLGRDGLPPVPHHAGMAAQTSGRTTRRLDTSAEGPFGRAGFVREGRIGADGKTLFFSLAQQVSALPGAAPNNLRYYAVELRADDGNRGRTLLIGHDDVAPAPHYVVRSPSNEPRDISAPGQPDVLFASLGNEDTEVNFYVVKFTFGAEGDRADIYRNPEPDGEPATPTTTLTGADLSFDRVSVARFVGANPVHRVDEIHFGTTWTSVIPKPRSFERELAAEAAAVEREFERLSSQGADLKPWREWFDRVQADEMPPWEKLDAMQKIQASAGLAEVDLGCDTILFVKRHMFKPTHVYTEVSDGPFRGGGGLFLLSPVWQQGTATMIFDAKEGIVRDPEVSPNGTTVLFSYRPSEAEYYHIYEMDIDGGNLRQITSGPFHDLDPFYLPDGRIGMTSTRCKSRALCFWVRAATLFVMDADGSNVQPLTSNNVNEFTPQMLPDGRILYTRWEYMDKSAIFVQSLWSILPDGTRAQQVYGNSLIHPVSLLQARLIPGTRKIACVLAAHNGDSVGPLAVVDPTLGMNNIEAILDLAPEANYHSGCCAPYPLNSKWCLVSYGPDEPFGIYAFDLQPPLEAIQPRRAEVALQSPQHPQDISQYWPSATGRRHLVYRDPVYSCVEAMPVRARGTAPLVASVLPERGEDSPTDEATLVLIDVYDGLGGVVPPGAVKYLRVVEEMGHRNEDGCRNFEGAFDQNQFHREQGAGFMSLYAAPWERGKPAPSLQAKFVYGVVPVEPDGSAHFTVPAERPIYLQALDAEFNEIQRMRSYIHLQPGEKQSCIGCHEHRFTAPPAGRMQLPLALERRPSNIEPPPWGPGPFSYQAIVQPVLNRHCTGCHAPGQVAGALDLTGRLDGRAVPLSFATLVRPHTDPPRPPLVDFFDNWWGTSTTVPVARPLSFGTAKSRLVEMIDTQHAGVDLSAADREQIALSPEERRAITTWIDLNCPLWSDYSSQRRATVSR